MLRGLEKDPDYYEKRRRQQRESRRRRSTPERKTAKAAAERERRRRLRESESYRGRHRVQQIKAKLKAKYERPWVVTPAEQAAVLAVYANRPPGKEVDHIIPLTHPAVCGLHVAVNLQYLSPSANNLKSNRFTPHSCGLTCTICASLSEERLDGQTS